VKGCNTAVTSARHSASLEPFTDRELRCEDCGRRHIWTARRQDEWARAGRFVPPSKCEDCRARRKAVVSVVEADAKGDLKLRCKECGQRFEFSAGEQQFFASCHWSRPSRCKPCRAMALARRSARRSEAV
jgi:hypothetical protein